MNKKELQDIVKKIKLQPSDEILENIEKEFNVLNQKLEHISNINVEGVLPMSHVDETAISLLREDVPSKDMLDKNILLANAPKKNDDFVLINKVIK